MTNKEFDRWLRESLSSVHPENPQDWDHFVRRVEESESMADSDFDEAIRQASNNIEQNLSPDWSHMEQMLNADEMNFDQHVKQSVTNFEVPYNASTWPTLNARISEDERIRRRLVYAKVLEIVAILIVFVTFYNFFPALKSSVIDPAENLLRKEFSNKETPAQAAAPLSIASDNNSALASVDRSPGSTIQTNTIPPVEAFVSPSIRRDELGSAVSHGVQQNTLGVFAGALAMESQEPSGEPGDVTSSGSLLTTSRQENVVARTDARSLVNQFSMLSVVADKNVIPLATSSALKTPFIKPRLVSASSKTRFGMMAAADVNTLFFPEQRFYSQGRWINFSEKEIVAGGYSAGASLLFDMHKFIIETGLTYSSKNFGPDRKLFIGSTADRHSLDFENITLNIVSLPLYVHWKLDGKGLWRVYAIGGASMHVIANANYDLIAEELFASSAAPPDPLQLQNEREVKRVREHMLDGAEFKTKGYVSAAAGLGVERYLNTRISVFAQPMYQYQISFFGLIDQNGKHLQNGSLLLGTRITL